MPNSIVFFTTMIHSWPPTREEVEECRCACPHQLSLSVSATFLFFFFFDKDYASFPPRLPTLGFPPRLPTLGFPPRLPSRLPTSSSPLSFPLGFHLGFPPRLPPRLPPSASQRLPTSASHSSSHLIFPLIFPPRLSTSSQLDFRLQAWSRTALTHTQEPIFALTLLNKNMTKAIQATQHFRTLRTKPIIEEVRNKFADTQTVKDFKEAFDSIQSKCY